MKILALGYRRKSGKDTLATMIQRELRLKNKNLRVNVSGFADQLKQVVYSLYGWLGVKPASYYESYPSEKEALIVGLPCGWKTVRDIWIAFGNHSRDLDRNIWMNALLKTTTCDVLIIKDMRFLEEINAVKAHGGRCVCVERPGTNSNDGQPDTVLMDYKGWDLTVVNNGTLTYLHDIAVHMAGDLL